MSTRRQNAIDTAHIAWQEGTLNDDEYVRAKSHLARIIMAPYLEILAHSDETPDVLKEPALLLEATHCITSQLLSIACVGVDCRVKIPEQIIDEMLEDFGKDVKERILEGRKIYEAERQATA